ARIERQYGRARRIWAMDRGIPTEAVLQEMRESDPPVHYLVGTPKGRCFGPRHPCRYVPSNAACTPFHGLPTSGINAHP
ncbi:MAG: hypothetical protein M3461_04075, partial [Pseudomonadota bacterium]|nr:hypothetical protein [Pseudomonadota bacterium]